MQKKVLEVEGEEIAIFSTKGIMAIVPKNKVNWVKKKLNEGCHECIDEFVKTLPDFDNNGQKAEDGVVLGTDPPPTEETDPPKRRDPNQKFYESETIPETYQAQYLLPEVGVVAERPKSAIRRAMANLNPKNWFVEDYSNYNTRDEAYAAARQAGEPEFMYNGERFNTKMAGTPQQQLQWSGITDERIHERKFLEERGERNIYPFSYTEMERRGWDAFVKNKIDPDRIEFEADLAAGELTTHSKNRKDAFNLYLGRPQTYDTFSVSKYRPGRSTDENAVYYAIQSMDDKTKRALVDRYENLSRKAQQQIADLNLTEDQANLLKEKYLHTEETKKYGFIPTGAKFKEEIPGAISRYLENPSMFSLNDRQNLKDFLNDAGRQELAEKIAPYSKNPKLTKEDEDVLRQFGSLATLFHNYDPKTRSIVSVDQNAIMGQYNLSKGVDPETGREYVSYRDLWDIKPYDFGSPFEIYDRIYLDELNQDKK